MQDEPSSAKEIQFQPIGIIRTPYKDRAPHQPVEREAGKELFRLIRVQGNEVITSPLDAFDETPLLDIKPYIKDLDAKPDANFGWIEDLEDWERLMFHIRGIPHHG